MSTWTDVTNYIKTQLKPGVLGHTDVQKILNSILAVINQINTADFTPTPESLWKADVTYPANTTPVLWQDKWLVSNTANNLGNVPINTSGVVHPTWRVISASSGSGISEWESKVYPNTLEIVFVEGALYYLDRDEVGAAPYVSVDFAEELLDGVWASLGGIVPHNSLSGLNQGDYQHLTASELATVQGITRSLDAMGALIRYNFPSKVSGSAGEAASDFVTVAQVAAALTNANNWDTAYGWGNHADAGYATTSQLHNALTLGTNQNGLSLSGQTLSLGLASASANGALSSANWTAFNNKQAALDGSGFVKANGTTISYDNSTYLTGITSANVTTALGYTPYNSSNPAGYITGLPFSYSTGVNANHVVQRDGSGYIYAKHINFNTGESENPTINSFIVSNGDGWSRKASLQHVRNSLGNYGGWITGETDTLASVTNRGFTTGQNIQFTNGRKGLVGVHNPAQTQAVFAIGSAYTLTNGGGSANIGNLYGLAWSYNPNYGGAGNNPQSISGLNHQLLLMQAGVTTTALGSGIWTSGNATAAGFFQSSDERLKDLVDYEYNVESIKPITYTWKDKEDKTRKIGYSAQEVQKVLPEAIIESKEGFLAVDYIQVLVAKIEMLENRLKKLEHELE
jgi:hypothetical protein